jgi:outer membrane biosynthesis protein TonB
LEAKSVKKQEVESAKKSEVEAAKKPDAEPSKKQSKKQEVEQPKKQSKKQEVEESKKQPKNQIVEEPKKQEVEQKKQEDDRRESSISIDTDLTGILYKNFQELWTEEQLLLINNLLEESFRRTQPESNSYLDAIDTIVKVKEAHACEIINRDNIIL